MRSRMIGALSHMTQARKTGPPAVIPPTGPKAAGGMQITALGEECIDRYDVRKNWGVLVQVPYIMTYLFL